MTSSNYVEIDFSSVSYDPLEPHFQFDSSDSGLYTTKGGLADNIISKVNTTLQDNISLTLPVTPSQHISSSSTFSFLVSFEHFHVIPVSQAGSNKIYKSRRSRSFFFEVIDQIHDTNEIHLKIYTNDYHMSKTPIRYSSTSMLPNHRFQILKCLTHFFSRQRIISRRIQNKFFGLIRKKLLERIDFIRSRG